MKKNQKTTTDQVLKKIIAGEIENLPFIMEAMQPNDNDKSGNRVDVDTIALYGSDATQ